MSDHQNAAEALRLLANTLEADPDCTLDGELVLKRWNPVTREQFERWVKLPIYANPLEQDRTQTTKLSFAIREEAP